MYYSHGLGPLAFFFILSIFANEFRQPNFQNTKFELPNVHKFISYHDGRAIQIGQFSCLAQL
jgi:hypothetical protein